MLFKLVKADQVFLSLWNEDFNQVYNQNNGFYQSENLDGQQLKQKFESLHSDVIYVSNARLHTLIRDIQFFTENDKNTHVYLLPLIDDNDNRIGVLGLNMSSDQTYDFESIVHQIESIGQHITDLYDKLISENTFSQIHQINFDQLPAAFFNFSIDKNAELLDYQFSKYLIRNHPAFLNYAGNSSEMIEPLLQMDLVSFTKMIVRSKNDQSIEYVYPYLVNGQEKKYFLIKLHVSLSETGIYQCLAVINDISIHRTYCATLDQILFDISHVMRRPVVSMKGLTNLIDLNQFDRGELYDIAGKIKVVSDEMEDYIKAMFKIYEAKQATEYNL
ncbi:hypothetical protein QYS49_25730 [Marivirga salinae]|uniref:Uncharacterized protein n=1 Tax=Marivirga salinarum TaxID=3059078 RepID=A0AA49GBQ5_9BACT|nr:hypothetical protein [Marivirga sp. BDSF4-3]WKK75012.2 hypothetical protein QYS49_25730 [Marivirga sp. BDSF4-3]